MDVSLTKKIKLFHFLSQEISPIPSPMIIIKENTNPRRYPCYPSLTVNPSELTTQLKIHNYKRYNI